jgi:hypothetical protein
VSIAMSAGAKTIDAYVTEVLTRLPAAGIRGRGDLPRKTHEQTSPARAPGREADID